MRPSHYSEDTLVNGYGLAAFTDWFDVLAHCINPWARNRNGITIKTRR